MVKNPGLKVKESKVTPYEYQIVSTIKLPRTVTQLGMPFDQVILNRRSARSFQPMSLQQLGELLWYSAKVITLRMQDNNYILSHRPAPSAGARHPIDIIVYGPKIFDDSYFYLYNPFEHSLHKLADSESNLKPLVSHVQEILPLTNATLLWFVAHSQRTSAKYTNPTSLVWRDSGALISCIQLTCTAMGLGSCPVGSLGEPYVSGFFNEASIFGTGGVLVGGQ